MSAVGAPKAAKRDCEHVDRPFAGPRISCQECGKMLKPGERHSWPECIERRFFGGNDSPAQSGDVRDQVIALTGALRILLDHVKALEAGPHPK